MTQPPVTGTVERAADRRRSAWKNGGGVTEDVGCFPPSAGLDDFDWRISLAEVAAPGPFSSFPGVARTIVLIDGAAMLLTVDGVLRSLQRHVPFEFDGAAVTTCDIPGGPTRDLNVMTRRGRAQASTEVLQLPGSAPVTVAGGDPLVLLVLAGAAVTATFPDGSAVEVGLLDAVCWPSEGAVSLRGAGAVAAVRFTRP